MSEFIVFMTAPVHGDVKAVAPKVRIKEAFDLGDIHAAHVDAGGVRPGLLADVDRVTGVYPNVRFSPALAPEDSVVETGTDNVVSEDDISRIHHIPEDLVGTGDGVSVVVMDSGRDSKRMDVPVTQIDMTKNGDDRDDVGHGHATLNLIHQIAPGATLTALRIFGQTGSTTMNVILRGYQWLIQNAENIDLVNMSWGGDTEIPEIDRLHSALEERGVLPVVSSGNSGGASGSPANAPESFSVGAITLERSLTSFSSYNPPENPTVVALGKNVLLRRASDTTMGTPVSVADDGTVSVDANGYYTVADGTSFSAPIVTGLAALLIDEVGIGDEHNDYATLPNVFDDTSADIEATENDGHGIAQLAEAVDALGGSPTNPDTPNDVDQFRGDLVDFIRGWEP